MAGETSLLKIQLSNLNMTGHFRFSDPLAEMRMMVFQWVFKTEEALIVLKGWLTGKGLDDHKKGHLWSSSLNHGILRNHNLQPSREHSFWAERSSSVITSSHTSIPIIRQLCNRTDWAPAGQKHHSLLLVSRWFYAEYSEVVYHETRLAFGSGYNIKRPLQTTRAHTSKKPQCQNHDGSA